MTRLGLNIFDFNPRTHMECDFLWVVHHSFDSRFQSTHSHGVRRKHHLPPILYFDFNPRTHMECDDITITITHLILTFQSTHSHGVRPPLSDGANVNVPISIHALTWSATPVFLKALHPYPISIHALTWSATMSMFQMMDHYLVFQSTHSHGVRRHSSLRSTPNNRFQSTHSHGVRRVLWESEI